MFLPLPFSAPANGRTISPYEKDAIKRCNKIGIAVKHFLLDAGCKKEQLCNTIRKINGDASIHAYLMFRPLQFPEKDVNCMTAGSLACMFTGQNTGHPPCTAQACIGLLDHYGIDLAGKRVAVTGRSLVKCDHSCFGKACY